MAHGFGTVLRTRSTRLCGSGPAPRLVQVAPGEQRVSADVHDLQMPVCQAARPWADCPIWRAEGPGCCQAMALNSGAWEQVEQWRVLAVPARRPGARTPRSHRHDRLSHATETGASVKRRPGGGTRAGLRTRSGQSMTSGSPPVVADVGAKFSMVVRPGGSQHGSGPHTTPDTVAPWCSSPAVGPVCRLGGPRRALARPRGRLLPNLTLAGSVQDRRSRSRSDTATGLSAGN